MRQVKPRIQWLALLALMLIFAACKGESPTAPAPGGGGGAPGGGTGGGTSSGTTVTVTTSADAVTVNQTVQVTAVVQINGQPAPDGTAVEFFTTLGTFADSGTNTTLRTTTNGRITVGLSSATAGNAVVTAQVGSVRGTSPGIRFNDAVVEPPRPNTNPTVTGATPLAGQPTGGETIRITGTNFRGRVRVFFDVGENTLREAQVVAVTPTTIDVITPAVQLAPGQTLNAPITVVVDADSATEVRLTVPQPFVFRTQQLTPVVTTVSPNSGHINGGTRVTIFGNSFQSPVQVLFGLAEARVIETFFDKIIVETPPARMTTGDGSEPVSGTVPVSVVNINSGTRVSLESGFRYTPGLAITGISPLNGTALGGTDVTVNGIGFDGRLQVTIGNVEAQILSISGTRLLVRTGALASGCTAASGPVIVRNLDTGAIATSSQSFSYTAVTPLITSVADATPADPLRPGEALVVTVQNPGIGNVRFTINGQTIIPSPAATTAGTGTTTFTVPVPLSGFTFPTVTCGTAPNLGTQLGSVTANVTYTNVTTNCTDTLNGAVRVDPPGPNVCAIAPIATVVAPAGTACADAGSVVAATAGATGTATITISNSSSSSQNLTLTAGTPTNPEFTISPATASVAPGASSSFTITFDPTSAGTKTGNVTFTTNAPARPSITVCLSGTGT